MPSFTYNLGSIPMSSKINIDYIGNIDYYYEEDIDYVNRKKHISLELIVFFCLPR